MPERHNFADRLLTLRNHLRLNQDAFAKKIGVSQGYLAKVETGAQIFSRKIMNRIATEFGIGVAWLETGEGRAPFVHRGGTDDKCHSNSHLVIDSEYVLVPLYPQSTGDEKIAGKNIYVRILVLKSWVQTALRLNPDTLSTLLVEGDSMSPTFTPGDAVLIDQSRGKENLEEGIYLIILNESSPLLKRLQPMAGGKIRIISDNPRYEPMTLSIEESKEIRILGKIVGKFQWL